MEPFWGGGKFLVRVFEPHGVRGWGGEWVGKYLVAYEQALLFG